MKCSRIISYTHILYIYNAYKFNMFSVNMHIAWGNFGAVQFASKTQIESITVFKKMNEEHEKHVE